MTIEQLLIALAGRRGMGVRFSKINARIFLQRFTDVLLKMEPGDALNLPGFGKFKKKTRAEREIVGFDGETTYLQPPTVVLTFRQSRAQKPVAKKTSSGSSTEDGRHWGTR